MLELLAQGSLAHRLGLRQDSAGSALHRRRMSLLEALRIGHSLATALCYLHTTFSPSAVILHRDLKPDNIGFDADHTLKLFDFGLAAVIRSSPSSSSSSETFKMTGNTGTLRYMAPEVVLNRAYNASVDVYSFSILLWQVVSHKVPFAAMNKNTYFQEVVLNHRRLKLPSSWPEGFRDLLGRCWHEDPAVRPAFPEIGEHAAFCTFILPLIPRLHRSSQSTHSRD